MKDWEVIAIDRDTKEAETVVTLMESDPEDENDYRVIQFLYNNGSWEEWIPYDGGSMKVCDVKTSERLNKICAAE